MRFRERRESVGRWPGQSCGVIQMQQKSSLLALTVASVLAASTPALAQNAGAAAGAAQMAPGTNGIPPVGTTPNPGSAGISPAPGGQSTTGTGITTGTGTGQI